MLVKTIFLAAALSAVGLATDIEDSDIPYQCRDVCNSFIKLTKDCDAANYGPNDDANELACICNAENSRTQLPICEACVTQYDKQGSDNDVNKLVRKCNFPYATYNTALPPPISTTAAAGGPPPALKPSTSDPATQYSGTAPPPAAPTTGGGYGNGSTPTTIMTAPGGGPPPPLSVPTSEASGTSKPAEQSGNVAAVNGVQVGWVGLMGVGAWFVGAMQLYY